MVQITKSMFKSIIFLAIVTLVLNGTMAQNLQDDFEGSGTISVWKQDASIVTYPFANPNKTSKNNSNNVLRYEDLGGDYANVFFDVGQNIDMNSNSSFKLKVYVPSSSVSGSSPNQVSLKLQDGTINQPWTTQTEIIQPLQLDTWQELIFDFKNGNFINLDAGSANPVDRTDFNRVLIQVNGEANKDSVTAYLDDFSSFKSEPSTTDSVIYNKLIWSDEFNGTGAIDTSKWFHQTKLPNGKSWYNGEIQHYTNRQVNSYQAAGALHIVAKKETFSDQGETKNYTSARLNSKIAFTYGRVEVRAKLPEGAGTWPAIWMLGKNIDEPGGFWQPKYGTVNWPACGEIDIMEHWGNNQNYVQSAMHTPSSSGATVNKGGKVIPGVSNNFHVYAVDWFEDRMVFSYDSVTVYVYKPAVRNMDTWPFVDDQYILLNIAIEPSISPSFTQSTMEIDYVRIFTTGEKDTTSTKDTTTSYHLEKQRTELKLFPNPSIDVLNIDHNLEEEHKMRWEVYSYTGSCVLRGDYTGNPIIIRSIPKGFYTLRLYSETLQLVKPFQKQ